MMILIPYKKLSFRTQLTKAEFMHRLNDHENFSKTKNFFNATTEDFLITTMVKGNEILIKSKYEGRRIYYSKIGLSFDEGDGMTIKVRIVPKIGGVLFSLPLIILILLIPSPMILKVFIIGFWYALGLIGFGFDVWWTKDLFQKRLLRIHGNQS